MRAVVTKCHKQPRGALALAALAVALGVVAAPVVAASAFAADAPAPTRDVTMPGKVFEPARITVLTGTTVTWRNGDATNHTVTADGDAFDSGYVGPGGSFSYTFAKQGHYAYHCQIHKFMKGEVDVYALVLTGPDHPVVFGRPVVVSGLAAAGTASVSLRKLGSRDPVRTVKARPDGSFTARVPATAPGAYRASAGTGISPSVLVSVVPHVNAVRTGKTLRVSTVPARPGARVALQVYVRDYFTWRTVARSRLDATSHTSLPLPPGRPARVRAVVRGDRGWADGATQQIVLR
jgi:plastocyanin